MNAKVTVLLLTVVLIAYFVLMAINISDAWKNGLFLITPFMVIGAVILVLKDRSFDYPELKEGEEFGYLDRKDP